MTQSERIIRYMQDFGSITPMQAFSDLGVTKLATRISEMRREGIRIHKEPVSSVNRYGDHVRFMRYSLQEVQDEQ